MGKKAATIAVLSVLTILLIVAVAIFFSTQSSFDNMNDNMQNTDPSNGQLPGASVLATILGLMAVWFGFILGEFIVSIVGFLVSCFAIKIAPNGVLKGISIGFFVLYSLMALVMTITFAFVIVAIV